MAALSFDDLVPASTPPAAAKGATNFDDLIPAEKPYSGSILPFSRDAQGNVSFDPSAGVLAPFYKGTKLTQDVAEGRVDPMSPTGVAGSTAIAAALGISAAPGIGSGEGIFAAPAFKQAPYVAPSTEALQSAASAGYKSLPAMGVDYAPSHIADLAAGVQADPGFPIQEIAPKTHAILNKLQAVTPDGSNPSVPLTSLESARQMLGRVAHDYTPGQGQDSHAAGVAQKAIDSFVAAPPKGAVLSGDAATAAQTLKDARDNQAAAFRSDRLNGIANKADLAASAANSGANIGNSTRQRVAALLGNDKLTAGFSDDEIAGLNDVVHGTPTRNSARAIGNLLGGGGGMHAANTGIMGAIGGYEAAGVPGAAAGLMAPAVGYAAKRLDNNLSTGALSNVDAAVRGRSPVADALMANPGEVPQALTKSQAIAKALALQAPAVAPPPAWQPGQPWNPAAPLAGGSI